MNPRDRSSGSTIRPARDTRSAPPKVKRAATRAIIRARRDTAAIKAKRSA
jgi:hypothetical protein